MFASPFNFLLNLNLYYIFNFVFQMYHVIIILQFENHIKQSVNNVFLTAQCLYTPCPSNNLILYFSNDISFQPIFNFMPCIVRLQLQCCSTQSMTNYLGPSIFCYLSPSFVPIHKRNSKFIFCNYCVLLCLFRSCSLFPSTYIISWCLIIVNIQW